MGNTHRNNLWKYIQAARVDISAEEPQGLWNLVEEKATEKLALPARGESGLWQSLQQRLDLSRQRPKRIAEYDLAHPSTGPDQEYYVLKNPAVHAYVKCPPQDFFLWEMMDGQHTVRDLAVAYFAKFGSFPFERMVGLIVRLNEAGLLKQEPVHIFDTLSQRFEGRSWVQRLDRWANALLHHELRIRNPDPFFEALYRRLGWVFFSRTALTLYVPLTMAGLILFLRELYAGADPLLKAAESYGLGVLLLVLINCLLVPIHECAHGLACKHYGREVLGAGVMLYYGSPAFFVDTNDMWLAPKRARIAASWAGPFSTALIASIASISMALLPASSPARPFLPRVAFMGYLSTLMNLNPLLEWDGYFMLMDYLEIPRLRQKALEFAWRRLPKFFREKTWSREKLLFVVFGLLSAGWTAVAFALGLRFVQSNLIVMLRELRTGQDLLTITVVGAVVLVYGLPRVGALVLKLVTGLVAGTKRFLHRISVV